MKIKNRWNHHLALGGGKWWHQRGAKFWKKNPAPKTTSLKTLTNGSVPGRPTNSPFGGWVHPLNLTWNLKRRPQKRKFLLETIIFRFHVKFRGSTQSYNLWKNPMETKKRPHPWTICVFFVGFADGKKHVTFKQIRTQMVGFFQKKSDESHRIESMEKSSKNQKVRGWVMSLSIPRIYHPKSSRITIFFLWKNDSNGS